MRPAWKTWTCDGVGNLERVRGALEQRREAALGMKETCEKTMPLLKEMLEKQENAAEMNRLFVEVDRLRGKVGQDSATFEMVAFLNTVGEMRKYQADLGVKTSKKNSLEAAAAAVAARCRICGGFAGGVRAAAGDCGGGVGAD